MLINSYDPPRGEPASDHNDIDKQDTSKPRTPAPEDPKRNRRGGAKIERSGPIEKDEFWDAT